MKKALFIAGIILIIAGVLFLLLGGLFRYSFYHTVDGSNELYKRLHSRAVLFLATGAVTEVCGIAALAVRNILR